MEPPVASALISPALVVPIELKSSVPTSVPLTTILPLVPSGACVLTLPAVSYTHLRAHETCADLVCRLLLEKKK